MHPRNSKCNDVTFEELKKIEIPSELSFDKAHLIQQKNGEKWNILREFQLIKNGVK